MNGSNDWPVTVAYLSISFTGRGCLYMCTNESIQIKGRSFGVLFKWLRGWEKTTPSAVKKLIVSKAWKLRKTRRQWVWVQDNRRRTAFWFGNSSCCPLQACLFGLNRHLSITYDFENLPYHVILSLLPTAEVSLDPQIQIRKHFLSTLL